jgi:hypothetical protein
MRALIFGILVSLASGLFPQSDSSQFVPQYHKGIMYHVKTSMGLTYTGFIIEEEKDYITLESKKDKEIYSLKKKEIVSARKLSEKKVYNEFAGTNYHANTYLCSGSSLLYDKPETTVNYQWFFLDNISYSMNEHWDLTVNSIFIYPVTIGVKCAYEIGPETYLGGNVFAGGFSNGSAPSLLIGYGGLARLTKGNTNNNFSVSAGVLGIFSDAIQGPNPFLNLPFGAFAYNNRFREKWAVCVETFYFPQVQGGLAGGGFKFLKNKETAWSFGCYTYLSTVNNQLNIDYRAIPIPFINYSRNIFGNR